MMKNGNEIEPVNRQLAETLERVARCEPILERLQAFVSRETASDAELSAAREAADTLRAYYESDAWKQDYAADEAGLLPGDLRRGVLSEDGIWNALEEFREWLAENAVMETPRLRLRRMSVGDLELIYRLYSDPEILRYSPFDTMDRPEAQRHLEDILQEWEKPVPENLEFAVVRREDQAVIGRCHIETDAETDTAMVGCHLLQAYWRQGYAGEICRALMDYSFETLGVHRVNALCNPENIGSRKVLEGCGLRLEAHFRKKCRYVKNGVTTWQDELQYAILREEWAENR